MTSLNQKSNQYRTISDDTMKLGGEEENPVISWWKVADHSDAPAIEKLTNKYHNVVKHLFRSPKIPVLIERSSFVVMQMNSDNEPVSFTSMFTYPNIPAVPSFQWFSCFDKNYKIDNIYPQNTMFIHYLVWNTYYQENFLSLLMQTIFMEFRFLKNIILVKPPQVKIPEIFTESFIPVLPREADRSPHGLESWQAMLVCLRHTIIRRLTIRPAIAEDHDDLMPIIERETTRLREFYGDFCIAEIIDFPGVEERTVLVGESRGYAVGMMSINTNVDLDLLNLQFHLAVFNGLRKKHPDDVVHDPVNFTKTHLDVLPETLDANLTVISSTDMINILGWKPSFCQHSESVSKASTPLSVSNETLSSLPDSLMDLVKSSRVQLDPPKFTVFSLPDDSANFLGEKQFDLAEGEGVTPRSGSVWMQPSLSSVIDLAIPQYFGQPNAFCIELFAMDEDLDELYCFPFLEAAFDALPHLDYCILTIPSDFPSFPLLDGFIRASPRPTKQFRHELYVIHRSTIAIDALRVQRIKESHLESVESLLTGIKNKDMVYSTIAFNCLADGTPVQSFALFSGTILLGVAVISTGYDMRFLLHHYRVYEFLDLDLHRPEDHAILVHLQLSPIYQHYGRYFIRDVMRKADVTAVYRARYGEIEEIWRNYTLNNVISLFVPLRPRKTVQYHVPSLGDNVPPQYMLDARKPFTVYHINMRICSWKKYYSNFRVVVVGASRTAFSFLERLIYDRSSAYLTFNNITLVDPHGIGTEGPPHEARDLMFPYRGKYNTIYNLQLSLRTYIGLVYGIVTQINRQKKYVVVNDQAMVPYDYLVLCCGTQYQAPVPEVSKILQRDISQSQRQNITSNLPRDLVNPLHGLMQPKIPMQVPHMPISRFLMKSRSHPTVPNPPNLFLVNTKQDATNAHMSLQYFVTKQKDFETNNEMVVVYGHSIRSLCCLQSLLKFGVPAKKLVFVEPFPDDTNSVSVFNEPNIEQALAKTLKSLGVGHYKSFYLYDWTLCGKTQQISQVVFHSKTRHISFRCLAMFSFHHKRPSLVSFEAVNNAYLVYDGRLVIDDNFQTNDPYIFAGGSFTKYKRRYHVDMNFSNYCSVEVGKALAEVMRKKIDPTEDSSSTEYSDMTPMFTSPVYLLAQFPDDWNYFQLRSPGKPVPLEVDYNHPEFGDVLTTGDCYMTQGKGYFKLRLDETGFVRSITCFTKDVIEVENLVELYNKHERLLNNLLIRYDLGEIPDLFAFFRQPWSYALYHDRFKYLSEDNQSSFENDIFVGEQTFMEYVVSCLEENDWNQLSDEKMRELRKVYRECGAEGRVLSNMMEFISTYSEAFPMYASPMVLKQLLHPTQRSILTRSNKFNKLQNIL